MWWTWPSFPLLASSNSCGESWVWGQGMRLKVIDTLHTWLDPFLMVSITGDREGSNITLWHSSPFSSLVLSSSLSFFSLHAPSFSTKSTSCKASERRGTKGSHSRNRRGEKCSPFHTHTLISSPSLLHSSHFYPYSFCPHLTLHYLFTITSYPPFPTHHLTTSHPKPSLLYPSLSLLHPSLLP